MGREAVEDWAAASLAAGGFGRVGAIGRGRSRGVKHLRVRIQRHWCYVADSIDEAELLGDGARVKELRIEECRFGEGGREEARSAAIATRGWHDAFVREIE
jgi:hypothetical protein